MQGCMQFGLYANFYNPTTTTTQQTKEATGEARETLEKLVTRRPGT